MAMAQDTHFATAEIGDIARRVLFVSRQEADVCHFSKMEQADFAVARIIPFDLAGIVANLNHSASILGVVIPAQAASDCQGLCGFFLHLALHRRGGMPTNSHDN